MSLKAVPLPIRTLHSNSCYAPPRTLETLIERPELSRRLQQGQGRVTVLVAPPGSGKTSTLMLHYAHLQKQSSHVRWLTLTPKDNQPEVLARHLTQALSTHKDIAQDAPWQLPEHLHAFVDGLELLQQPEARDLALECLLSLPGNSFVYTTLHQLQGPPLQEAKLRGLVQVIDASELRMNDAEAAALMEQRWDFMQVQLLNQRMQGWAAGLRLLQRSPSATRQWLQSPIDHAPLPHEIAEYLEEVLCVHLEPQTLDIYMQLGTLGRFCPEILAALPSPPCNWAHVEQYVRSGCFLHTDPQASGWVRAHPAIAQYLKQRLQRHDPARYQSLKHFAASWFAEQGFASEAIRHAVQLKHTPHAERIIEQVGAISVDLSSGPDVILASAIPAERASELPLAFLGQVYYRFRQGRIQEARSMLEAGRGHTQNFSQIDDCRQADEVRAWALTLTVTFLTTDDQPITAAHIEALEAEYQFQVGVSQVLATSLASVLAFVWLEQGLYAKASAICGQGLRLHAPGSTDKAQIFLYIHQASAAIAQGTLEAASAGLQKGIQLAQLECGPVSYEMHTLQLLQTCLAFERNQLDSARQQLQPVLQNLRGVYGWVSLYEEVYSIAAYLAADSGGMTAVESLLLDARQFANERQLHRLLDMLNIIRLREMTRAGAWNSAQELLETPEFSTLLQPSPHRAFEHSTLVPALLAAAQLQMDLGRASSAQLWLERLPEHWQLTADQRHKFQFHILYMRICHALRQSKTATVHLQAAVEIASLAGLLQRSWQERQHLTHMVDALQRTRRNPLPKAVTSWIHNSLYSAPIQRISPPPVTSQPLTIDPCLLSPREHEVLALMAEGCINKEIASQLGISEGTVKTHRKHIHEKLGVSSRSQAIQRARDWLLI